MQVVDTFGKYVGEWSETRPETARKLLKTGWQAMNFKYKHMPDQRLMSGDQYLCQFMMDDMIAPLKNPEDSVIVSIFTPCELMQEVGLNPYNVEGFSCYLLGSHAEQRFLRHAENIGIAESLCSYHKAFIGAAETGLLPKPKCIVYTNLTCDANLLTFRHLAEMYDVPSFFIDVPLDPCEESVPYVEKQLRELAYFLMEQTGRNIDEESLKERLRRSKRTQENYSLFQQKRADKYMPTDLVTPLYAAMTNNILMGTEEEERYIQMLLQDVEKAEPTKGTRLYWMHTIPFWSESVHKQLYFNENAQIVGCELGQVFCSNYDPEKPYEAMARRMVYHALNGNGIRRIENGIRCAKEAGADGVVWFNHWGCKHTLGNSLLAKKKFEEAGLPLLILDSDGCDRSHGGEGQIATRLEAFLEMLGGGRVE